jgi:hypothetical protein
MRKACTTVGLTGLALLFAVLGGPPEAGQGDKPSASVGSSATHSSATHCVEADCEMFDGTRLRGRLSDAGQSLDFRTSFGAAVRVPYDRLSQITVAEDRESTTLHFENGDRLTGFMAGDGLTVLSGGRETAVAFPKLRHCRFKSVWAIPAGTPLKFAGASASGAWGRHVTALAIDGDDTTYWNAGTWQGWLECDLGRSHQIVRIEISILFSPAGGAQFDVYASDKPMGAARDGAQHLKQLVGNFQNGDLLTIDCPRGTQGRHVQISCPRSISWFAIREVRVFPPEEAKKAKKPE